MIAYFVLGTFFGLVLTKAEVISWFRVQEMFRFHAWHMYGTIASAVFTAAVSLALLRRAGARTRGGEPISLDPKVMGSGVRYLAGGTLFGVGWAFTGACPGPLLALAGAGLPVFAVALLAAAAGAFAYGWLRPRLPH